MLYLVETRFENRQRRLTSSPVYLESDDDHQNRKKHNEKK